MIAAQQRHEVITERIVEALIANKIPWRNDHGFPTNVVTRQRYTGVNPLLLNLATEKHNLKTPWWGTWSQWKSQGRALQSRPESVPLGTWGTEIVLKGENQELNRWTLYNMDQVQGGFDALRNESTLPGFQKADELILGTNAKIQFKRGIEAIYYFPPKDFIVFPLKEQFEQGPGGLAGYYNSLFHEIAHWTEPRLKWNGIEVERELRAEITADFLTSQLRLPRLEYSRRSNHHDFLGRWVTYLCSDPSAIFNIAEAASKAVDYILACNVGPRLYKEEVAYVEAQQGKA